MKKVFIACDFYKKDELLSFINVMGSAEKYCLKIGPQLLPSIGYDYFNSHPQYEYFLDLKLYDIPETVKKTVANLTNYNIQYLTVHLSGGPKMLKAAAEVKKDIKLLGVTTLTSFTKEEYSQIYNDKEIIDQAITLIDLSKNYLDGVICSVLEAKILKSRFPKLEIICPGIRLNDYKNNDDQSRVATPEFAREQNVDGIVVGRPITESPNPKDVYNTIRRGLNGTQKN